MTKARARAADDEGDDLSCPSDPVLACLGPVRPAPRELHCSPAAADGTPACKLFMRGKACKADCAYAHDPPSLRPPCWTFERYGVCPRDVLREKDPDATPCWFPHTPREAFDAEKPEKQPHLALQCELGVADRVAARCRDLLGADAVVDAARLNLARAADCLVFVRSAPDVRRGRKEALSDNGFGVFAAARALARDPHLMATLKRAYCVSVDGVASADTHGAGSISVAGDSRESMLRAVTPSPSCSAASRPGARRARTKRNEKGKFFTKKCFVKARCFLVGRARRRAAALEPSAEDARWFEPIAKHATHVLDVVCHRNRATSRCGPRSREAPASAGGEGRAEARETRTRRPAFFDWKRVSDVVHDVVHDERRLARPIRRSFRIRRCLHRTSRRWSISSRSTASARKEARASKKPMSRAYFKLEEAADRAGVPLSSGWQCVDVGAAPGGWTQWISDRLTATATERGKDAFNSAGRVWAVDPGDLELRPFPTNVAHVKKKAELAVTDGSVPANDVSLLVCDANGSPELVTSILLEAKPTLRRGAYLVTTFKNFCRGYVEWRRQMSAARARFANEGFTEMAFFHSFANCAQEFTYVARFAHSNRENEKTDA